MVISNLPKFVVITFAIFLIESMCFAGRSGKKEEQKEQAKIRSNKEFKLQKANSSQNEADEKQKERNEIFFQLFENSTHVLPPLSLHDLSNATRVLNHFVNQDQKIAEYFIDLSEYQQKQFVITMCLMFDIFHSEGLADRIFEINIDYDDITAYDHPFKDTWFEYDNKATASKIELLKDKIDSSQDIQSFLNYLDKKRSQRKSQRNYDLKECFYYFVNALKQKKEQLNSFIDFFDLLQAKI